MTYKLMLKEHNVTGLKYLCITKKDNYEDYHGSGSYWTKHIKKHGYDVTTTLLAETDSLEELQRLGEFYSEKFNVVESDEFANMIPERGYAYPCDDPFYKYNRKSKEELYKTIAETNREIWKNKTQEEKEEHGRKMKARWDGYSIDERNAVITKMKSIWDVSSDGSSDEGAVDHVGRGYGIERRKQYSEMVRTIRNNKSDKEKQEWNDNISKGRLAMSEEAKQARKEKILEFWAKNEDLKQRRNAKLSSERKGFGNPAARVVEYDGVKYTKGDFEKKFGKVHKFENDPKFKKLYEESTKVYPQLTCPYCGKKSDVNKLPTAFLRWHFENCREKNKV